eukprot:gene28436-34329_t
MEKIRISLALLYRLNDSNFCDVHRDFVALTFDEKITLAVEDPNFAAFLQEHCKKYVLSDGILITQMEPETLILTLLVISRGFVKDLVNNRLYGLVLYAMSSKGTYEVVFHHLRSQCHQARVYGAVAQGLNILIHASVLTLPASPHYPAVFSLLQLKHLCAIEAKAHSCGQQTVWEEYVRGMIWGSDKGESCADSKPWAWLVTPSPRLAMHSLSTDMLLWLVESLRQPSPGADASEEKYIQTVYVLLRDIHNSLSACPSQETVVCLHPNCLPRLLRSLVPALLAADAASSAPSLVLLLSSLTLPLPALANEPHLLPLLLADAVVAHCCDSSCGDALLSVVEYVESLAGEELGLLSLHLAVHLLLRLGEVAAGDVANLPERAKRALHVLIPDILPAAPASSSVSPSPSLAGRWVHALVPLALAPPHTWAEDAYVHLSAVSQRCLPVSSPQSQTCAYPPGLRVSLWAHTLGMLGRSPLLNIQGVALSLQAPSSAMPTRASASSPTIVHTHPQTPSESNPLPTAAISMPVLDVSFWFARSAGVGEEFIPAASASSKHPPLQVVLERLFSLPLLARDLFQCSPPSSASSSSSSLADAAAAVYPSLVRVSCQLSNIRYLLRKRVSGTNSTASDASGASSPYEEEHLDVHVHDLAAHLFRTLVPKDALQQAATWLLQHSDAHAEEGIRGPLGGQEGLALCLQFLHRAASPPSMHSAALAGETGMQSCWERLVADISPLLAPQTLSTPSMAMLAPAASDVADLSALPLSSILTPLSAHLRLSRKDARKAGQPAIPSINVSHSSCLSSDTNTANAASNTLPANRPIMALPPTGMLVGAAISRQEGRVLQAALVSSLLIPPYVSAALTPMECLRLVLSILGCDTPEGGAGGGCEEGDGHVALLCACAAACAVFQEGADEQAMDVGLGLVWGLNRLLYVEDCPPLAPASSNLDSVKVGMHEMRGQIGGALMRSLAFVHVRKIKSSASTVSAPLAQGLYAQFLSLASGGEVFGMGLRGLWVLYQLVEKEEGYVRGATLLLQDALRTLAQLASPTTNSTSNAGSRVFPSYTPSLVSLQWRLGLFALPYTLINVPLCSTFPPTTSSPVSPNSTSSSPSPATTDPFLPLVEISLVCQFICAHLSRPAILVYLLADLRADMLKDTLSFIGGICEAIRIKELLVLEWRSQRDLSDPLGNVDAVDEIFHAFISVVVSFQFVVNALLATLPSVRGGKSGGGKGTVQRKLNSVLDELKETFSSLEGNLIRHGLSLRQEYLQELLESGRGSHDSMGGPPSETLMKGVRSYLSRMNSICLIKARR